MQKYNAKETFDKYDTQIIRPEVRDEEIKLRGEGFDKKRLKKIKEGLITLHNLEIMAANTYRFQLNTKEPELNRELIAAMLNEMVHIQDFQVKLLEFGWKPSIFRYFWYCVGIFFGLASGLFGANGIRKMGSFVERKAVAHYQHLLETIDWDEDTRKVIEKNWIDEFHHIQVWEQKPYCFM